RPALSSFFHGVLWAGLVTIAACSKSPSAPSGPPPPPTPDPPSIVCPAPVTTTSPNGQPVMVSYSAPTVTLGAPPVTSTCVPPSGASFNMGATMVTCTATDAKQRTASCTFMVTVAPPPRLVVTRFVAFGDSITWGENGSAMSVQSQLMLDK